MLFLALNRDFAGHVWSGLPRLTRTCLWSTRTWRSRVEGFRFSLTSRADPEFGRGGEEDGPDGAKSDGLFVSFEGHETLGNVSFEGHETLGNIFHETNSSTFPFAQTCLERCLFLANNCNDNLTHSLTLALKTPNRDSWIERFDESPTWSLDPNFPELFEAHGLIRLGSRSLRLSCVAFVCSSKNMPTKL